MADLDLGKATSLRAPEGLLEKARAKYQRYTPNAIQEALRNAIGVANVIGLNDPSSVGGSANASIAMLAKSKEAASVPGLRESLEYAVKRWPRLSGIGKESRFVESLPPGVRGEYDPVTGLAQIALNEGGKKRSVADILRSVGHELIGHGRQVQRGMRDYPIKQTYSGREVLAMPERRRQFLQSVDREASVPYERRASEIDARLRGNQFVDSLNKARMVPQDAMEGFLMQRRSGLQRSIDDMLSTLPTEIKSRPRSGSGSGPLGLTDAEYKALRGQK